MIPGAATRLVASPIGRVALLGLGLLGTASLALSPDGLAPVAARAAIAAGAIAAAAVLLRRRGRAAGPAPHLSVLDRAALGRGVGVAVVEAGGRRLLVGFGRDGVRFVANLGASDGGRP